MRLRLVHRARAAAGALALALLVIVAPSGMAQAGSSELEFELLPELPNPTGLGGPIVGTSGEALLVGGGANFPVPLSEGGPKVWHDEVYALLPGASNWSEVGKLPGPLAYAACASTEDGVLIVGGSDVDSVSDDVWLMRWQSGELVFDSLPGLPTPCAFGAAEVIGHEAFVLGGKRTKDDTDLSGGFWKLDLTNTAAGWQALAAPPGPARFKAVTAIAEGPDGGQELFLFSGSRTTKAEDGRLVFEMFTDGHRYTPSNDSWTAIAELPVLDDPRPDADPVRFDEQPWPINAACALALGRTRILTFSGSTGRYVTDPVGDIVPAAERPDFLNRVLAYDTGTDSWSELGSMPIGVVTTRAALWDGRIVVPSGETRPGIRTPAVQALAIPASDGLFGALDYTVLGIYLALMVLIGIHFARRDKSTEDFFLGGRKIPWWAAGISIFGTQLSAITFMAIPATAYGSDWRRFVGSLALVPVLVLVITYYLPFFRRLRITTAYELLEARFSRAVRLVASTLFILFQLGRMGIVLLLPAIALSAVTGMDTYLCILMMGVLATIYTALGGISAVIWTDVLQVFVLIGGALLCLVSAVVEVGGLGQTLDLALAADKLHMFDWRWSWSDMVAWVLVVGFLFTNLVPYTTDQTVIQRYLTTKSEKDAARSLWLNLAVTIPTGILFYGLGTALFAYYSAHPGEAALLPTKVDQLVPWFVVTHLPAGLAGLIVAGIFAAAMSSLDSSMNSITTAVVSDFLGEREAGKSDGAQLGLARKLTVVLGVIGTLAAMVLATYEIKYLFDFFQKVIGLFGGGLAGVFLLAIFTTRATARGALAGLVAGGAATIAVATLTDVNFLLYAAVGNLVCVVVGLVTSSLFGGPRRDLAGLTIWTRGEARDV